MQRASPSPKAAVEIDARRFDLVVFDLDGVLTDTATLHAEAWKRAFDGYLTQRAGPGFRAFDAETDYRAHVDGRPRLEGVRRFLASRAITLREGDTIGASDTTLVKVTPRGVILVSENGDIETLPIDYLPEKAFDIDDLTPDAGAAQAGSVALDPNAGNT